MNTLCRAALMAVLVAPASGFSAVPGAAASGHCQPVGGSVFTNFVDPTDAVGPVSGDLAGAVSVQILAINGNVYHIRKHFVTTSGDTMTVADTDFTTYPTSVSGLAAATEPMTITGGTGRFDGATGSVTFFGAINGDGEVTLRYSGTICFKPAKQ
jgi:hypothetical protein